MTRDISEIKKLNIGCGLDSHPDFINLDIVKYPEVDIVHDIRQPWPFKDNYFDEVHANHVLEHCHELIFIMNESFKKLARPGLMYITVPWWAGEWAHGDPTHVRFFDHNSFSVFSDWYDRYKYLGLSGPWIKLSQNYYFVPPGSDTAFLNKMGFSTCLAMSVVLQKPAKA